MHQCHLFCVCSIYNAEKVLITFLYTVQKMKAHLYARMMYTNPADALQKSSTVFLYADISLDDGNGLRLMFSTCCIEDA